MRGVRRSAAIAGLLAGCLGVAGLAAQSAPAGATGSAGQQTDGGANGGRRRGELAGMGRVMGEVTAVAGNTLTIKAEDGHSLQVVTTDNTRVMKDRGPVRVSDLHVGDGLMAMGNLDAPNKTLHAAVVMAEDATQIKTMKENLGKTYITGRVTAVDLDSARMTVERSDHVSQTIGFDETTSFKRAVRNGGNGGAAGNGNAGEDPGSTGRGTGPGEGRGPGGGFGGGMSMAMGNGMDRAFSNGESITLADIKAGDFIAGTGTVKGGTFVPTRVVDSPPRRARGNGGAGAPGTQGTTPTPAAGQH